MKRTLLAPLSLITVTLGYAACQSDAADPVAPDPVFGVKEAPADCDVTEGVKIRGTSIYGTNERDVILCHRRDESRDLRIFGKGGDDSITGGTGDDYISGGPGCDRLRGNEGDDEIDGGPGDDGPAEGPGEGCTFSDIPYFPGGLWGGPGDDILRGGPGFDRMYGDEGDDDLDGGSGCDNVRGGPGNDVVAGGPGDDLRGPVPVPLGNGVVKYLGCGLEEGQPYWGGVRGDDGDDLILGGPGIDSHVGHAGYDVCDGGPPQRGHEAEFFHQSCEEIVDR